MTEDKNHEKRTTGRTLDDLYRVAAGIEEKVEEILEELQVLSDAQREHPYREYDWRDALDEINHY